MVRKPGYPHEWDENWYPRRHILNQNSEPPRETLTYESNVKGFERVLKRNKKLDRVMKRKAYDIKAQMAARLPESNDKSRRKRASLKQSMAVRRVNPGGYFLDRPTYQVYDTTSGASMGRVRLVDWLSRYPDDVVKARLQGKDLGSAVRPSISTRAMRAVGRGKSRG